MLISLATPAKSLFNAKPLTLSKFKFFPVNNSASISFWILDSKSSILLAIFSTPAKSVPSFAASTAASANLSGTPPTDNFTKEDALLTSNIIFLELRASLFEKDWALIVPIILFV